MNRLITKLLNFFGIKTAPAVPTWTGFVMEWKEGKMWLVPPGENRLVEYDCVNDKITRL